MQDIRQKAKARGYRDHGKILDKGKINEGIDDGKLIKTNVGSGLTDNNREEFWKAKDKLIDQVVEVRADAITQNQDGTYSLRFPRFKTFRGFEAGEKM